MHKVIRAHILDRDPLVKDWMNSLPYVYAVDDGDVDALRLEDVDMLVFTGGSDVHPSFYKEEPLVGNSWYDKARDIREIELIHNTRDTHYHFGICRGLQVLAVAHGYKLWQDIGEHNGGTHSLLGLTGDYSMKRVAGSSSAHHQAVRLGGEGEGGVVYAVAENDNTFVPAKANNDYSTELLEVVEAMWFPASRSFGVQGHPEYPSCYEDYLKYVQHHLLEDDMTGYLNMEND